MTVKELRSRLFGMDDDAEVEVLVDVVFDFSCNGDVVKEIIVMQIDNGEEKTTRVVLMA